MMNLSQQLFLTSGSIFAFLAVTAGAFGAHFLKQRLSIESLAVYETAVRYQMYHALALILVAYGMHTFSSPWLLASGWFFIAGTLLFSGSLYLLVFSNTKAWGMLTPVGGLFFLLGWLAFCVASRAIVPTMKL